MAVVNTKGGVGKTTLAGNLAVWLHGQGKKVILVDCDAQGLSSRWVSKVEVGVHIERLQSEDDVIEQCPSFRETAEYVVADGPGGLDREINRALLLRCDLAVVPCVPGPMDVQSTMETIRLVKQAQSIRGGNTPQLLLVLNKIKVNTRLSAELTEFARNLDIPHARNTLGDRQVYSDAVGQDQVVWSMKTSAARIATGELEHLLLEILEMSSSLVK